MLRALLSETELPPGSLLAALNVATNVAANSKDEHIIHHRRPATVTSRRTETAYAAGTGGGGECFLTCVV